jgi:hypothetical protein
VPEQPYAWVASETEVEAVIDLAAEAEDDPHAELRTAFEHDNLTVERMDGVWVVEAGGRNPRRQAAQVATLAGPRCAVLARDSTRATVILRDGPTVAIAESAGHRWRIYRMSPLGTPLSLLCGDDGLPPTRANYPLRPLPGQVQQLAISLGVNPVQLLLAAELPRA